MKKQATVCFKKVIAFTCGRNVTHLKQTVITFYIALGLYYERSDQNRETSFVVWLSLIAPSRGYFSKNTMHNAKNGNGTG